MLAPQTYSKDCYKDHGRLFGHSFSWVTSLEALEEKRMATKAIWDREYPGKPFDLAEDLSTM